MKTSHKADLILLWVNSNKPNSTLSYKDRETLKEMLKKQVKKHGYQDLILYLDVPVYLYQELFI